MYNTMQTKCSGMYSSHIHTYKCAQSDCYLSIHGSCFAVGTEVMCGTWNVLHPVPVPSPLRRLMGRATTACAVPCGATLPSLQTGSAVPSHLL